MKKAGPRSIGDIISELLISTGAARVESRAELTSAWQEAAGCSLARMTFAATVRKGVLEVIASNSACIQELTLQQQRVLVALNERLPGWNIRSLKFRIGTWEDG
jgi:predicted nucleic acid-binding Zn ribbon protein